MHLKIGNYRGHETATRVTMLFRSHRASAVSKTRLADVTNRFTEILDTRELVARRGKRERGRTEIALSSRRIRT